MQIIKAPEPFSPAFGEILYVVSLTEEEKGAEIGIFNSPVTEKIGIKKATEAPEFTLNVSDYVRSQVAIRPFPVQDSGIIDASERIFQSCIAPDGRVAASPHTAGIAPVGENEPMCDPTVRFLGENEQDEICWIAGTGTVFARVLFPAAADEDPIDIHLGRAESDEPRMLALILNSGHLDHLLQQRGEKWEDYSRFTVEIHFDYRKIVSFEYRIRPKNPGKTRLAWWNRYGAIDFYSFESTSQERMNFERKQVAAGNRTVRLSSQGRREKTLHTARTTREQAAWLSDIAGSPQVWIAENDVFIPAEILNEKPFPVNDPEETTIELRVAYSQTTPYQSF